MHHKVSSALLATLGCTAGLVLTGIAAFAWPLARAHDAASLAGFQALAAHPLLAGVAKLFASSVNPLPKTAVYAGFAVDALSCFPVAGS